VSIFTKKSIFSFLAGASLIISSNLAYPNAAKADDVIAKYDYGCSSSRTYRTWWGTYTWMNSCAITDSIESHQLAIGSLVASTLFVSKVPGPYVKLVNGVQTVGGIAMTWNATRLSSCKDKTGQAYIRYVGGWGNHITGNISCN
jgi:hypothetical protein